MTKLSNEAQNATIVKEQTFINESGDIEHTVVSIYETGYVYYNIKISGDFEQNIITKFGVTLDSGQIDGEGKFSNFFLKVSKIV